LAFGLGSDGGGGDGDDALLHAIYIPNNIPSGSRELNNSFDGISWFNGHRGGFIVIAIHTIPRGQGPTESSVVKLQHGLEDIGIGGIHKGVEKEDDLASVGGRNGRNWPVGAEISVGPERPEAIVPPINRQALLLGEAYV